jgi:hypothetical protein
MDMPETWSGISAYCDATRGSRTRLRAVRCPPAPARRSPRLKAEQSGAQSSHSVMDVAELAHASRAHLHERETESQ